MIVFRRYGNYSDYEMLVIYINLPIFKMYKNSRSTYNNNTKSNITSILYFSKTIFKTIILIL